MRKAKIRVAEIVADLPAMSLADLRKEWERRYGAPPRHRSSDLLRRVLAWRVQADAYGGFDAATRQMLAQEHIGAKVAATAGMRLAREWAGKRHEVVVVENGVIYQDQTFGSLSEVARHITGKRWNGPRFFGLRQANVR